MWKPLQMRQVYYETNLTIIFDYWRPLFEDNKFSKKRLK